MKRKAKVTRKTKETSISVEANIDGKGKYHCFDMDPQVAMMGNTE